MIAYPLLQHSIKQLEAYSNGELKEKDSILPEPTRQTNGDDTIF
jgi:hypothetical protein